MTPTTSRTSMPDSARSPKFTASLKIPPTAPSCSPASEPTETPPRQLRGKPSGPRYLDGYGSYVAIDPSNSQNWYAQSASGVAIDLCSNGSSCASAGFGAPVIGYPQVGSDAYAFSEPAPFLLDPQSSANLILGTCHVWRGPADGDSWSDANLLGDLYPGEGPECDGNAQIQSLAASGTVSTPVRKHRISLCWYGGNRLPGSPGLRRASLFRCSERRGPHSVELDRPLALARRQ